MTAPNPDENRPVLFTDGQMEIDAAFIAERFGFTLERTRVLMRQGQFRSLVEKGEGEDEGRWRLTLRCGNRVWQGIVTADGRLHGESAGLSSGQRPLKPVA